jgi:ribonuclease P protein component
MDQSFRRTERLRHALQFRRVFERGRIFRAPGLRVHYRPNEIGFPRLGLVVSRKVGKAVVRNRVKRLLRDVFRRSKRRIAAPLDIVLIPQDGPRTHAEYLEAFLRFAEKVSAGEPARRA